MNPRSDEQRLVPRFPLPKEKIKFFFEDGERVFAVRDISVKGVSISLLEPGESLLFPMNYSCKCELKLNKSGFPLLARVARVSAWSVGFIFDDISPEFQEQIRAYVDPIHISSSLRLVDKKVSPNSGFQGISAWYHGDSGADLYFWNDPRGGINRAMFCLGKKYWEWEGANGVSTGTLELLEEEKVVLHKDATPDPKVCALTRKVLEHAEVLDYRLVSFLKDKT